MWKIAIFTSILGAFFVIHQAQTCNEAVCGSIVSKCLLTQSCKCDLKNCTCCKDCYNCLSYLYEECCSCVGEFNWNVRWTLFSLSSSYLTISRYSSIALSDRVVITNLHQLLFLIGICPKSNDTETTLSTKSHIEEFSEPVPGLFNVLTEYPDNEKRWNSTTFPINIEINQISQKKEIKIHMRKSKILQWE